MRHTSAESTSRRSALRANVGRRPSCTRVEHLPTPKRRVVGYSVTEIHARRRLLDAAGLVHLAGHALPAGQVPALPEKLPFDVFVYDLAPFDEEASAFVQRFRSEHPRCPLLLYRPMRSDAARLAGALAHEAGVVHRVQLPHASGEAVDLAEMLRVLLQDVPRLFLERIVRALLDPCPPHRSALALGVIEVLAGRTGGIPSIIQAAEAASLSRRRVYCAKTPSTLSSPKRLVRCVTLAFLALEADWRAQHVGDAAKRLGVNDKALDRLKREFLPCDLSIRRVAPSLVLDHALRHLNAFGGWSRDVGAMLVERAGGGDARR